MAVGTGFGQVFRGLGNSSLLPLLSTTSDAPMYTGQVCGVAVSSALFQSRLDSELRARIQTPDAEEVSSHMRYPLSAVLTNCHAIGADNQPDSPFDDACRAASSRFTTRREGLVRRLSPGCVFPSGVFDAPGIHRSASSEFDGVFRNMMGY